MKLFQDVKKKTVPAKKEILRGKFRNFVLELKVRGFSEKTIDSYLYFNGTFLDFVKKEPRSVSSMDIKSYLNSLVLDNLQPRTINLAISSLKAYYRGFLGKRLFRNVKRSKTPKDLPQIPSKEEIKSMIETTNNMKHKLLIELVYSSGMRVGELVKTKIDQIDIKDKIIFIKKGKGKKDRLTITSAKFIKDLKDYLTERKRPSIYLFDNAKGGHITERAVQNIVKLAALRTGIKKRIFPHLFRASFTTHLLESGIPIEKVQKLLGHERISTTLRYARIKTDDLKQIKSPLD